MNQTTKIPHMETIRKTAEIFGLPVHFVRAKVSSGEVVAVRAGRRFLVNVDKFAEYLNTSTVQPESGAVLDNSARITPISLK
ncbi:MAG: hypothetical protein ACI4KM_12470 [Oscillospiraceae bacterium]